MNNLLSYCGLSDARMRASEKDLPVYRTGVKVFLCLKLQMHFDVTLICGLQNS